MLCYEKPLGSLWLTTTLPDYLTIRLKDCFYETTCVLLPLAGG